MLELVFPIIRLLATPAFPSSQDVAGASSSLPQTLLSLLCETVNSVDACFFSVLHILLLWRYMYYDPYCVDIANTLIVGDAVSPADRPSGSSSPAHT